MIALISSLAIFLLAPAVSAQIVGDLNCTSYNGTAFVYTNAATVCSNTISDQACAALYPLASTTAGSVAPGNSNPRPFACYSTVTATPAAVNTDMKTAAIANCPKTCGYCCQTSAYSCANAAYPRLNCATITNDQCLSATWRTIIAVDCPAACGFCNEGGCVDAVTSCANDITICNAVGLQDFVNANCQRTCARCPSTTVASSASSSTCTSYNADSSTSCASWSANGFCTNTFYTAAVRKSYCATTCKLC